MTRTTAQSSMHFAVQMCRARRKMREKSFRKRPPGKGWSMPSPGEEGGWRFTRGRRESRPLARPESIILHQGLGVLVLCRGSSPRQQQQLLLLLPCLARGLTRVQKHFCRPLEDIATPCSSSCGNPEKGGFARLLLLVLQSALS